MRKIKIRAWDQLEEKMYYDLLTMLADADMWDDERDMWSIANDIQEGTETCHIKVTESVDKKDIVGTDMYNGDIVEVNVQKYVANCYIKTTYTCVAKYKDGRHYFAVLKPKKILSGINAYPIKDIINMEDVESNDCKVIGNKFENPELLSN